MGDSFRKGLRKSMELQYSFQLTDTLKAGHLCLAENFLFSPAEFWSKSHKKLSKRRAGN